jgi:hypothetical protein
MSGSKYTPGPWRWEINPKSRIIQLCGGKPKYDLTVLGFTRWGMNSAQPVVMADKNGIELLCNAENFKKVEPGREHHRDWFQLLDHPDLNLIAAAPDLLVALRDACEYFLSANGSKPPQEWLTAIAKAEGRL